MRVRTYESMVLLHPDVPEADVDQFLGDVQKTVTDHSGAIIKAENWGKRRLAYRVQKQRQGTYCVVYFNAGPELVDELKRRFRINEKIMKFLLVRTEEAYIKDKSHYIHVSAEERREEEEEGGMEEAPETTAPGERAPAAKAPKPEAPKAEKPSRHEPLAEATLLEAPAEAAVEEAAVEETSPEGLAPEAETEEAPAEEDSEK